MRDAPASRPTAQGSLRAAEPPDAPGFLRAFLGRAPVAAVVLDEEGRLLDANARAEALVGAPRGELSGRPFAALLEAGDARAFARALRASGEAGEELAVALRPRGGGGAVVGVTFIPVPEGGARVLLVLRDLAPEPPRGGVAVPVQARPAEDARERDPKLAALGCLVAGVVHELRTPLTYSRNLLQLQREGLMRMRVRHPEAEAGLTCALEQNAEMLHGNERAAALLRQLRPLAQNRRGARHAVDLAELAVAAAREFHGTNETRVRLVLDLQGTRPVLVEKDEMLAAILNLLRNGAQALGGEGALVLQTRSRDAPPEIRVVDRGPGVPAEVARHLFEPFRTTKEKGTGLGLFIARQAVEAHGGTLTHEPTPGGGATFVIRFPEACA